MKVGRLSKTDLELLAFSSGTDHFAFINSAWQTLLLSDLTYCDSSIGSSNTYQVYTAALGHGSSKTTEIYTHVSTNHISQIKVLSIV